MALTPAALNGLVRAIYNLLMEPNPHVDHTRPIMRTIGRHGFRIQDEVLCIPLRWGFFSPGPSRLQAMEGCLFASLLTTVVAVAVIIGVCAYRGESYLFLLWCSAVIPVACISTYIEARQYRAWVPLSWRRPICKQ